jgi:hypothetical protein
MESASTYQAVEAVAPGRLELARKPVRDPGPSEARIRHGGMYDFASRNGR